MLLVKLQKLQFSGADSIACILARRSFSMRSRMDGPCVSRTSGRCSRAAGESLNTILKDCEHLRDR